MPMKAIKNVQHYGSTPFHQKRLVYLSHSDTRASGENKQYTEYLCIGVTCIAVGMETFKAVLWRAIVFRLHKFLEPRSFDNT